LGFTDVHVDEEFRRGFACLGARASKLVYKFDDRAEVD